MFKLVDWKKGRRDYVHGPDIYNGLDTALKECFGPNSFVTKIALRTMAHGNVFATFGDQTAGNQSKRIGVFSYVNEGSILSGILYDVDCGGSENRIPYDEDSMQYSLDLKRRSISCSRQVNSTAEDIVSLVKAFNLASFPVKGERWIVSQFEFNSPLPERYSEITVKLVKNFNDKFTVSSVIVDEVELGSVRFARVEL